LSGSPEIHFSGIFIGSETSNHQKWRYLSVFEIIKGSSAQLMLAIFRFKTGAICVEYLANSLACGCDLRLDITYFKTKSHQLARIFHEKTKFSGNLVKQFA
jgi:hypothetical protein